MKEREEKVIKQKLFLSFTRYEGDMLAYEKEAI